MPRVEVDVSVLHPESPQLPLRIPGLCLSLAAGFPPLALQGPGHSREAVAGMMKTGHMLDRSTPTAIRSLLLSLRLLGLLRGFRLFGRVLVGLGLLGLGLHFGSTLLIGLLFFGGAGLFLGGLGFHC